MDPVIGNLASKIEECRAAEGTPSQADAIDGLAKQILTAVKGTSDPVQPHRVTPQKQAVLVEALSIILEKSEAVPANLLKEIQQTKNVNATIGGRDQSTALMWAVAKGTEDEIKALLALGANPLITGTRGEHVLNLAIKANRPLAIIKLIIDSNPDSLKLRDMTGDTIVHTAVRMNRMDVLEFIKENYPDSKNLFETRNYFGDTPTDASLRTKYDDVAEFLLGDASQDVQSLPLYGKRMVDISQNRLESKLVKYIQLSGESVDVESIISKGGQCNGWAFLYQYYNELGKLDEYKQALELLSKWNGEKNDLEQPINLLGCSTPNELFRDLTNHLVVFFGMSTALREVDPSLDQGDRIAQFELIKKTGSDLHLNRLVEAPPLLNFNVNGEQMEEILEMFKSFPGSFIDLGIGFPGHRTSLAVTSSGELNYFNSNIKTFLKGSLDKSSLRNVIFSSHGIAPEAEEYITWGVYQWTRGETAPVANIALQMPENSPNGFSRLHYAILTGNLSAAKDLLNDPALREAKDKHGNMPVDYAMKVGRWDLVELFYPFQEEHISDALTNVMYGVKAPTDFLERHPIKER